MLFYYNPKLLIILKIYRSDFVIDIVLSQKENRVQLISFDSMKMTATEFDYDVYDKQDISYYFGI
jgi:hypothetical protein